MFLYAFNTFDLLILCFLRYLGFLDFLTILGLRFGFFILTSTCMKLKYRFLQKNLVQHCNPQCNDQPKA